MNTDNHLTEDLQAYIADLCNKADVTNAKTVGQANCFMEVDGIRVPVRVDDHQLLFIGARLLPNILNYLVNILPQFLYPYVVAYLQELSSEENAFTLNDLYHYLEELNHGNILDSTETED